MKTLTKFWVRDKDRLCSATFGDEPARENIKDGFREVSAEEQDEFRAETKRLGKKPKGSAVINASAANIGKLIQDFNK